MRPTSPIRGERVPVSSNARRPEARGCETPVDFHEAAAPHSPIEQLPFVGVCRTNHGVGLAVAREIHLGHPGGTAHAPAVHVIHEREVDATLTNHGGRARRHTRVRVDDIRLPSRDDVAKLLDAHPERLGITVEEVDLRVWDAASPQAGAILRPVTLIARASARHNGQRMPIGLRLAERRNDLPRAAPEERCDVQHTTTTGGPWPARLQPSRRHR